MLDELPRFRRRIMKWLAGLGVPAADVEDLTQEVLSAAVRYSESYDPTKPLTPWLRMIARTGKPRVSFRKPTARRSI